MNYWKACFKSINSGNAAVSPSEAPETAFKERHSLMTDREKFILFKAVLILWELFAAVYWVGLMFFNPSLGFSLLFSITAAILSAVQRKFFPQHHVSRAEKIIVVCMGAALLVKAALPFISP